MSIEIIFHGLQGLRFICMGVFLCRRGRVDGTMYGLRYVHTWWLLLILSLQSYNSVNLIIRFTGIIDFLCTCGV